MKGVSSKLQDVQVWDNHEKRWVPTPGRRILPELVPEWAQHREFYLTRTLERVDRWTVSEAETGCCFGGHHRTPQAAVTMAMFALRSRGVDALERAARAALFSQGRV